MPAPAIVDAFASKRGDALDMRLMLTATPISPRAYASGAPSKCVNVSPFETKSPCRNAGHPMPQLNARTAVPNTHAISKRVTISRDHVRAKSVPMSFRCAAIGNSTIRATGNDVGLATTIMIE